MNSSVTFWQWLALFGATQGIFLAFLLAFHRRGNRTANRFLAALIFVFSLRLLEIVAFWTKYVLVQPNINATTWALPYLFGVLFYFYARHLVSDSTRIAPHTWLHFLPFVCYQAAFIPYYLVGAELKRVWLEAAFAGTSASDYRPPALVMLLYFLQFPHVLVYIVLTVRQLARSAHDDGNGGGHLLVKLAWLRRLTLGFGCFFGFWLLYNAALLFGIPYHRWIDYAVTYAMTFFIYAIGYAAFRQPELFSGELTLRNGRKYEKSTLTPEQADSYLQQLDTLMERERPFLNSKLKLPELARRLRISPHHLSQVINERRHQNFFDFINEYRIAEVKKLLADPAKQHLNLLGLAFEVGFNNKTSFNIAFKKHTGMTPSEYRQQRNAIDQL